MLRVSVLAALAGGGDLQGPNILFTPRYTCILFCVKFRVRVFTQLISMHHASTVIIQIRVLDSKAIVIV